MELRKCKCGNEFEPIYRNGILVSKLCYSCIVKKSNAKRLSNARKEKKEGLERLKTHSDYENELQTEINKIARLIDYGQPCICHPNLKNENGGHLKAVGGNNNIRFNLHNIHGQSIHSNKHKSGEPLLFFEGLRRVYGNDYAEYCLNLNALYPSIKLSKQELKDIRLKCLKIVNYLKKEERIYSCKERIELRNKYNLELNIYTINYKNNPTR